MEVERAYRRQALLAHPDRGGDSETFVGLTLARTAMLGEPAPPRAERLREPLVVIHTRPFLRRLLDRLIAVWTPVSHRLRGDGARRDARRERVR